MIAIVTETSDAYAPTGICSDTTPPGANNWVSTPGGTLVTMGGGGGTYGDACIGTSTTWLFVDTPTRSCWLLSTDPATGRDIPLDTFTTWYPKGIAASAINDNVLVCVFHVGANPAETTTGSDDVNPGSVISNTAFWGNAKMTLNPSVMVGL
jgi:hypothetical protein